MENRQPGRDYDSQCEFCSIKFHLRAKCIDDQTLDVTNKDIYSSDHTIVPIDFSSSFDNSEQSALIRELYYAEHCQRSTGGCALGPQFLILLIQAKEILSITSGHDMFIGCVNLVPVVYRKVEITRTKLTHPVNYKDQIETSYGLLKVLDLSNNSLSGMIPQCLGNFNNSLSVLNLRMNSFHATFTAIFVKGNTLRNLNLNDNQIEGQEVLDPRRNKINDTFPYWLETLPRLHVLVLKFNRFHGHIDTFKAKSKLHFPKLRIIDISYNEFTGLLPTNYISQFETMMNVDEHEWKLKYMGDMYYKDYVVVILKRHEIEYSRILTERFCLKSIGRLNSLRGLNLSHNNLKGHIPTSLGNLGNLESLDLSSNQLVGEIPQQLTSLMFLAVLNLSYNQLVGQIPQRSQFNTFRKDSYNGNWDLYQRNVRSYSHYHLRQCSTKTRIHKGQADLARKL
ncbi:hypothetical protein ACSBR1_023067 [Camellia fascicularis]